MLPLTLRDFERFRILDESLPHFFEDLRVCWVVTPDQDFHGLSARIGRGRYRIVRESEIVPEFRYFRGINGWFKQQLIKIAIAQRVETDFYLTLDADIICTKPLRYSDLIQNGRGKCFIDLFDYHPEYYQWSERVLKLPRSGACHNVTPAVMSREAMLKMQNYLCGLARQTKLRIGRRSALLFGSGLGNRWFPNARVLQGMRPWAFYLLVSLPWTEYSMYYTFLEATGEFEKYHFRAAHCLCSGNSLWFENQIPSWDPRSSFREDDHSFFLVVQSRTAIDPQLVWEKVRPLLKTRFSE